MKGVMSNTAQLKKINQERIRQAIKDSPNSTKAGIAATTGLSLSTCSNILNDMVKNGEVIAMDLTPSNGGRPAYQFIYNQNYSYFLCLYVNNENNVRTLAYAVVNSIGEVLEEETQTMELIDFAVLDGLIGKMLEKHPNIKAIGIGVPGEVQNGFVDLCDVKELENTPLRDNLQKKYRVEVTIENDMDFITYGYYKEHESEADNSLAVIYFSNSNWPGSGVVIGGQLLRGSTMFAGEISYASMGYGIARDEQLKLLSDPEKFPEMAVKSIISIVAIINPEAIVLIGDQVKNIKPERITELCLKVVPEKHMPRIIISNEIHKNYINGLIAITLSSLNYGIPVLKKGI